ncbi:unnamed protein product [Symbiodinium sp. CCMP2592]|nr:unnamed protein product [Symbiodinium sp. CCMP2592]
MAQGRTPFRSLFVLGAGLLLLFQQLAFTGTPGAKRQTALRRNAETESAVMTESEQLRAEKKAATLEAIEAAAQQDAPMGEDLGNFWVNQPGQLSFEVQFNRGDKVKDLRTVIEKVTGIPPDAQEIRAGGDLLWKDGVFLEGLDLTDIWVMDDRDDSPERGEWNPDPEEDMDPLSNPLKIAIYLFSGIIGIFWVTQVLGVNPYGNWPEGPRANWAEVPEDLRPGAEPYQRPQALDVDEKTQKQLLEQRLPSKQLKSRKPDSQSTHLLPAQDECDAHNDSCGLSLRQLRGQGLEQLELEDFLAGADFDEEEAMEVANQTGGEYSFYAYRAKNDKNYEDTTRGSKHVLQNVNMANLPGVMWYLHSEVVGHCPRKFGIVRILRYKITMKPTPELERTGHPFAHLCHFDSGACTGPQQSLDEYQKSLGMDLLSAVTDRITTTLLTDRPPGTAFLAIEKGGLCKQGEPWSKTCTWRREYAGEISLDELTHNYHFEERCKKGFYEYNEAMD